MERPYVTLRSSANSGITDAVNIYKPTEIGLSMPARDICKKVYTKGSSVSLFDWKGSGHFEDLFISYSFQGVIKTGSIHEFDSCSVFVSP